MYPGGANASSTSALLPGQPALISVIGVIRGTVFGAGVVACAAGLVGAVVQADTAARVRTSSATANAGGRNGRMSI